MTKRTLALVAATLALGANAALANPTDISIDPYWKRDGLTYAQPVQRADAQAADTYGAKRDPNSTEERNRVLQGYNP